MKEGNQMNKQSTPKERKEKKEIARKMMETQGGNYTEWLHVKHQQYIEANLIEYMNMQHGKEEGQSESERSSSFVSDDRENEGLSYSQASK